jgi:hypothetical protein
LQLRIPAACCASFHSFSSPSSTITQDRAGGWNFYIDGTKVANIPSGSAGMPAASAQMLYVMESDAQSSYTSQLFIHSMQWWSVY